MEILDHIIDLDCGLSDLIFQMTLHLQYSFNRFQLSWVIGDLYKLIRYNLIRFTLLQPPGFPFAVVVEIPYNLCAINEL